MKRNSLLQFWLVIAVIAGFAVVIFFVINYLQQAVLCQLECSLRDEVVLAIIFASLSGIFVGSLTYYVIGERFEKKIGNMHHHARASLAFLDADQRLIVEELIKAKGTLPQSSIVKATRLSRVKVSRSLNELESKGVLTKQRNGMTNTIELSPELRKLLTA